MERDGVPFRNPAVGKIPALMPGMAYPAPSASSSVFKETPLSPAEVANNLRDELKRMKRRRQLVPYVDEAAAASPSSSPSKMPAAAAVRQQQQSSSPIHSAPSSPEPMEGSSSRSAAAATSTTTSAGSSGTGSGSHTQPLSAKALVGTREKPVFTLRQMSIICERMCQERTDKVRQEYDKILQQKLSEQYDAFVKFIDHQIQQRFNQSQLPSYLS